MVEPRRHGFDGLVGRAKAGDRLALEQVVEAVRDDVYGLAMRMLWHPEDAEDATQEILIRVITHLASFRGESSFGTWVYRIASNHLLTTRRRRAEQEELTFEEFGRHLAEGLADGPTWEEADAERRVLIEEAKIGCSQAMLLCLDREHRMAYILGEILELPGPEAAAVLGVTAPAFRKRLSRARDSLRTFMRGHCGLVNAENACRCHRRVEAAITAGRLDPASPLFARLPVRAAKADAVLAGRRAVEDLRLAVAEVHRSNPDYASPDRVVARLQSTLSKKQFRILTSSVE